MYVFQMGLPDNLGIQHVLPLLLFVTNSKRL